MKKRERILHAFFRVPLTNGEVVVLLFILAAVVARVIASAY